MARFIRPAGMPDRSAELDAALSGYARTLTRKLASEWLARRAWRTRQMAIKTEMRAFFTAHNARLAAASRPA
jgi:hypothetical protein